MTKPEALEEMKALFPGTSILIQEDQWSHPSEMAVNVSFTLTSIGSAHDYPCLIFTAPTLDEAITKAREKKEGK